MTSIVGVFCTDGVVIGADSSTTFVQGVNRTVEQPTEKISLLCDAEVISVGTGSVGLNQRFCNQIEKNWKGISKKRKAVERCTALSACGIQDFLSTRLQKFQYGALVGFSIEGMPFLCEFEVGSMQPEIKTEYLWYVSMGSAQYITDTFLGFIRDVFWSNGQPNLHEGIFATLWTLQLACEINTGGVKKPIHIAVLEKRDETGKFCARILSQNELYQHLQHIDYAKDMLRKFRSEYSELSDGIEEIPKT